MKKKKLLNKLVLKVSLNNLIIINLLKKLIKSGKKNKILFFFSELKKFNKLNFLNIELFNLLNFFNLKYYNLFSYKTVIKIRKKKKKKENRIETLYFPYSYTYKKFYVQFLNLLIKEIKLNKYKKKININIYETILKNLFKIDNNLFYLKHQDNFNKVLMSNKFKDWRFENIRDKLLKKKYEKNIFFK